jgi:hypothetical protein
MKHWTKKKHSMTGKALNQNLTWARTMLLVLVVHSSPTKLYRLRKAQALCLKSTDSFFFWKRESTYDYWIHLSMYQCWILNCRRLHSDSSTAKMIVLCSSFGWRLRETTWMQASCIVLVLRTHRSGFSQQRCYETRRTAVGRVGLEARKATTDEPWRRCEACTTCWRPRARARRRIRRRTRTPRASSTSTMMRARRASTPPPPRA